jgi:hypothetical protein
MSSRGILSETEWDFPPNGSPCQKLAFALKHLRGFRSLLYTKVSLDQTPVSEITLAMLSHIVAGERGGGRYSKISV